MEVIKTKKIGNKNLTLVKFSYGYEIQLTNKTEILDTDGFYDDLKVAEKDFNVWLKELKGDVLKNIVKEKLRKIKRKGKLKWNKKKKKY